MFLLYNVTLDLVSHFPFCNNCCINEIFVIFFILNKFYFLNSNVPIYFKNQNNMKKVDTKNSCSHSCLFPFFSPRPLENTSFISYCDSSWGCILHMMLIIMNTTIKTYFCLLFILP